MMTLSECFSEISLTVEIPEDLCDDVQSINHTDYIVNAYPLYIEGHYSGGVIRYKEFSAIRRLERRSAKAAKAAGISLKTALMISLEKARSCGNAGIWRKKMAKGDGAILIEGRAASGKRNFAQAIHNASFRHESPLSRSTVLQYRIRSSRASSLDMKRAFTGARKGGKPGLLNWPTEGLSF